MRKGNLISALLILLASLCLIGCASTTVEAVEAVEVAEPLVADYSLVGYDFVFQATGNVVEFKFLDVASDEEVAALANAFMSIIPGAKEYSVPVGGTIAITAEKSLNAEEFNAFVEGAKQIIYNGIFR